MNKAVDKREFLQKSLKRHLAFLMALVMFFSVFGIGETATYAAAKYTVTLSKTTYTYNGKAQKPKVTVKDSKGKSIKSKNYSLSYSNNKNVGTAKVTVKMKNGYKGTVKKSFKINPKGTSLSSVTAKDKGFTVKWKKQSTQTTGYQLQYATDSSFKKNVASYNVTSNKKTSYTKTGLKVNTKYYVRIRTYKTVSGTKYYSSWSDGKSVKTNKIKLDKSMFSASDQTYSGKALTPVKSSTLKSGTDYSITYSNNTNAGTAAATITGKGNYTGTLRLSFKILPKSVTYKDVTISGVQIKKGQYYPSVIEMSGTILTEGKDYDYSQLKRVDALNNSVLITLKGNYSGSFTHSFETKTDTVSFSNKYFEQSETAKNDTDTWRQGMVSGNGMQGVVTTGAPYSDTLIFQNMHFILPNNNTRSCPETYQDLESVKQAIVNGENISDSSSYDDVYCFHPGAALRINMSSKSTYNSKYERYTDYQTGQVGVSYKNSNGTWERTTFTSMADGAVITKLEQSSKGTKLNLTLSIDDISTLANFGNGDEINLRYKKLAGNNADYIAMVAHYPDYENSELKNGGYATLTYIVTVSGKSERVVSTNTNSEEQYVGSGNQTVKITDADTVYLITISDRTYNMGALADFEKQQSYKLVDDLYSRAKAVAKKYYNAQIGFDYNTALSNHLNIYYPQYSAVTFKLCDSTKTANDDLLYAQAGNQEVNTELAQRNYYAGRYAYLCCSGYSTSRLYGMWTGEWAPGWGSKYTMDANVNLQTSSMNTGNITSSPIGYTYFILRQLPDWEENAYATHGFSNALQAPVNTDGDCAVLSESCYPYPFRYWNAGTSWMLQPLYETLQTYGNINIPLSDEFNLNEIKSILDLSSGDISRIEKNGYLKLEEDILLPLLTKSANYWAQLMSPEYYTAEDGSIHYEQGKTTLEQGESYAILPGYSPENNPSNYPSPATANCTIDISACKSNIEMLLDVMADVTPQADKAKWQELLNNLPPYLYDDTGALKEWSTTSFEENNTHRHLSHLYGVWPLFETQDNPELTNACKQAIANRESENNASHALIHRALISARLKDRNALSSSLSRLNENWIRYDSLMTNHDYNRGSCYCTDYAIGYLGIINESLVYSNTGKIEILPSLPTTGFDSGKITGLRARTRATVTSLEWNVNSNATVVIKSDIAQTITISSPMSSKQYTYKFKAGEQKSFSFPIDKQG